MYPPQGLFEHQSPPHRLPWPLVNICFVLIGKSSPTEKGEVTAAAVCASCRVPAQGHRTLELALAWDMPGVHFGSKEKLHFRWVVVSSGLGSRPPSPLLPAPRLDCHLGSLVPPVPCGCGPTSSREGTFSPAMLFNTPALSYMLLWWSLSSSPSLVTGGLPSASPQCTHQTPSRQAVHPFFWQRR